MLANLIEFVSNHYVLSSLFVALLILLFITETRKGGKSLSNRELTALVNSGEGCLLYTSPSPRDVEESRMPSSA